MPTGLVWGGRGCRERQERPELSRPQPCIECGAVPVCLIRRGDDEILAVLHPLDLARQDADWPGCVVVL